MQMWLALLVLVASSHAAYDLRYDRPRSCTGSARPGLVALRNVLVRRYPTLRGGGIYNCRSVRGASSISEHAEGRALDLMTPIGNVHAQIVADWLVDNARDLGIQSVIYNRRVWGYGRWNWRRYSGSNAHVDHVHVGMNIAASREVTERMVQAVLDEAPVPAPSTRPPHAATPCTSGGRTGQCKDQSTCTNGDVVSNLCPGPFNIKCCLPPAPAPAPPQNPRPPPGAHACKDPATGAGGVCQDFASCAGTSKSGLCPGPANIRCCMPAADPPAPSSSPQPVEQCVRCVRPVFVRSRPSSSGTIRLTAMVGEEFSKSSESRGWYRVSNSRGSGWSYRSYWGSCSGVSQRSLSTDQDDFQDGAAAAPRTIADDAVPAWAWIMIGFVAGIAIAGIVAFAIVKFRSSVHPNPPPSSSPRKSDPVDPLMGDRPPGSGSWSVIPQLRGTGRKRGSLNVKK